MRSHSSRAGAIIAALLVGAGWLVVGANSAHAATIAVTTTADGGTGSLRAAVATANTSGDTTIELQANAEYVLTCAGGGDLDHTSAFILVLRGNGATIRQTCADERVIDSTSAAGGFAMDRTTITGGDAALGDQGGGIRVAGTALIERSTIIGNNTASQGGGLALAGGGMITSTTVQGNTSQGGGGGLFATGTITVGSARITDNHAVGGGGGGMLIGGPLHVQDSTIDGNTAGDAGGGVFNFQVAETVMLNSTVTGNTSNAPGGGVIVTGGVEMRYTTIVDNGAPTASNLFYNQGSVVDLFGSVIALPRQGPNCSLVATMVTAYNFSDDDSCQLDDPTDLASAGDPALGPLQDNGGTTPTRLPGVSSPLLDRIPLAAPECAGDDQRGVVRPVGPACDIGAVERLPQDTSTTPPGDPSEPGPTATAAGTGTRPRFAG